jgi:hypothetical protein
MRIIKNNGQLENLEKMHLLCCTQSCILLYTCHTTNAKHSYT